MPVSRQFVPLPSSLTPVVMRSLLLLTFVLSAMLLSAQNQEPPKGKLVLKEEPGIIQLKRVYQEEMRKKGVEGYRVQLYNGSKKECEQRRAAFIKLYPNTAVQTIYESPEYKVQVGAFKTKLEAERFLRYLDPSFSGCFVVRSQLIL
jgi:hypothetical protein